MIKKKQIYKLARMIVPSMVQVILYVQRQSQSINTNNQSQSYSIVANGIVILQGSFVLVPGHLFYQYDQNTKQYTKLSVSKIQLVFHLDEKIDEQSQQNHDDKYFLIKMKNKQSIQLINPNLQINVNKRQMRKPFTKYKICTKYEQFINKKNKGQQVSLIQMVKHDYALIKLNKKRSQFLQIKDFHDVKEYAHYFHMIGFKQSQKFKQSQLTGFINQKWNFHNSALDYSPCTQKGQSGSLIFVIKDEIPQAIGMHIRKIKADSQDISYSQCNIINKRSIIDLRNKLQEEFPNESTILRQIRPDSKKLKPHIVEHLQNDKFYQIILSVYYNNSTAKTMENINQTSQIYFGIINRKINQTKEFWSFGRNNNDDKLFGTLAYCTSIQQGGVGSIFVDGVKSVDETAQYFLKPVYAPILYKKSNKQNINPINPIKDKEPLSLCGDQMTIRIDLRQEHRKIYWFKNSKHLTTTNLSANFMGDANLIFFGAVYGEDKIIIKKLPYQPPQQPPKHHKCQNNKLWLRS